MSRFLDRLRAAKRKAAADLQAAADAAQERARAEAEAEMYERLERIQEQVSTVMSAAQFVESPPPPVFVPEPLCANCGEPSAMFLRSTPVTWRDEATGVIRRVLASFCSRECRVGWRPG